MPPVLREENWRCICVPCAGPRWRDVDPWSHRDPRRERTAARSQGSVDGRVFIASTRSWRYIAVSTAFSLELIYLLTVGFRCLTDRPRRPRACARAKLRRLRLGRSRAARRARRGRDATVLYENWCCICGPWRRRSLWRVPCLYDLARGTTLEGTRRDQLDPDGRQDRGASYTLLCRRRRADVGVPGRAYRHAISGQRDALGAGWRTA